MLWSSEPRSFGYAFDFRGLFSPANIFAVVVVLMVYAGVNIPVLTDIASGRTFEVLLLAYILLWLGTTFRGL